MKDCAFDIIVIAGQSNAEGNGQKPDDKEFVSDKVFHLVDKNPIAVRVCEDKKVVLDMVYPVEMVLEQAHERVVDGKKFADFSETFAKNYIDSGYLEEGRKILIVKAAVGGTGFARKEWGIGSKLYQRLLDMINYALSLNEKNRIVAYLWHQGEHDCVENLTLNPDQLYNFYSEKFTEQTLSIRKKYGKDIPVITGGFADSWAELPENKPQCDAVEKALKDSCVSIGNAAMVTSEGLLSNDQAYHTGDNLHFCSDSVYELGKRYFKAYNALKK